MKKRLADYVVDFLIEKGVKDCFSVVGGGAMHLNDAFGHNPGIKVTYNHHEQACAIAAEAYARINNEIAAVCVTTGPGGTNAITGVVGGWLDSIPMFIVSGQVRYDTSSRYAARFFGNENLRSLGDQEYDIVKSVKHMTKYSVMIEEPGEIKYHLQKAWYLATTGRPGPVWIDIPVNFQSTIIDTEELIGFNEEELEGLIPSISISDVEEIVNEIRKAKRPVLYVGGGIRLSGGYHLFREVTEKLNIPVVTYWNSIDLIETNHPLYTGRAGNMGDRAGNFAVQNADLILAIGTRISIRQTGYNYSTWAREARVIMVDIDEAEIKKHTIHVEKAIVGDAKEFLEKCSSILGNTLLDFENNNWVKQCSEWKRKYPVVSEKQKKQTEMVNIYAFIDELSNLLPERSITVVSNGACCVAGHQAYRIKSSSRFIINNAIASMGYGIAAAIGVCVAVKKRDVICLEGDGSIMMNLQELQTIVTNKLPIKLFLINNAGYHSIRITQNNLFSDRKKIGIGEESGDLSFPNYKKIVEAFGIPYVCITDHANMRSTIEQVINQDSYVFCEIFTDKNQVWEPKSSTRKLEDGRLVSPPLEDLAPFLDREELKNNMYIDMIEE